MVRSTDRCQNSHLVLVVHEFIFKKLINFIDNRTFLYARSQYTNMFTNIQPKYQVRAVFVGLVFFFFFTDFVLKQLLQRLVMSRENNIFTNY